LRLRWLRLSGNETKRRQSLSGPRCPENIEAGEGNRVRADLFAVRDRAVAAEYLLAVERDIAAAYKADASAAEAALADTREALRNLLAWADETVEAITQDYGAVGADETVALEAARAVLAAVPPQQGAPADTDARPANNAGTRGGDA
jgi:hypothetical protein